MIRRMAGPLRAIGFAVCMMLLAQPSQAGRPFATDDAGVLASGDCELEAYGSRLQSRVDPTESGGWAQVGCGAGFGTQLAVGGGRFRAGDGTSAIASLVGKTALRRLTDDGIGVALAYAVGGTKPPDGSLRHARSSAALVVSMPRGRTLLHANLGIDRNHLEGTTATTYALAIERRGERRVDVGIELYGQRGESPWIGTGARYAIEPDKLFADLSFAARTGAGSARQLTIGLKYAF